jgi:uncharacterized protein
VVNRLPDLPGPVRTCVGCRQRDTKRELLRVTIGEDANGPAVVPDPDGTAPGRGAHLHPRVPCLELAERRRAFARSLRYDGGPGANGALSLERLREWFTRSASE